MTTASRRLFSTAPPLWLLAVALLLSPGLLVAAEGEPLPVDEDAIVREVDRLIDETGAVGDKKRQEATKLVRKGIEAHDAGDYTKAIVSYEKALAKYPLDSLAYYEMALSYSYMGEQAAALDAAIRSIALDPSREMAYVMKGNILDNLGFTAAAIQAYDQLIEIMPESYMGHINLAVTRLRNDEYDAAEEALRAAEAISPEHPSVHFRLAELARQRGWTYDEIDHLDRFVELGDGDRRLEMARQRLTELRSHDVQLDIGDPYPSIALIVASARSVWMSIRHRDMFPDAHAYAPTYEEEWDVLHEMLLPAWRETKESDPQATHGHYDMILKIDDAGYLDEYIYYTKKNLFSDSGSQWLEQNAERVDAFLAWAKAEGLVREEQVEGDAGGEADDDGVSAAEFIEAVFLAAEESDLTYSLGEPPTKEQVDAYIAAEAAEFRKHVEFNGEDQPACGKIMKLFRDNIHQTNSARADFTPVLRCHNEGSEEWTEGAKLISIVGLEMDDLSPPRSVNIEREGDTVHVRFENVHWMGYALAKAVWRNEADLRTRFGGPEEYEPTVFEEMLALGVTARAYLVAQEETATGGGDSHTETQDADTVGDDSAPTFEADPFLETLASIAQADHLRGYVLFEILHRRYGISLARLTPEDASHVQDYLSKWVIVKKGS